MGKAYLDGSLKTDTNALEIARMPLKERLYADGRGLNLSEYPVILQNKDGGIVVSQLPIMHSGGIDSILLPPGKVDFSKKGVQVYARDFCFGCFPCDLDPKILAILKETQEMVGILDVRKGMFTRILTEKGAVVFDDGYAKKEVEEAVSGSRTKHRSAGEGKKVLKPYQKEFLKTSELRQITGYKNSVFEKFRPAKEGHGRYDTRKVLEIYLGMPHIKKRGATPPEEVYRGFGFSNEAEAREYVGEKNIVLPRIRNKKYVPSQLAGTAEMIGLGATREEIEEFAKSVLGITPLTWKTGISQGITEARVLYIPGNQVLSNMKGFKEFLKQSRSENPGP